MSNKKKGNNSISKCPFKLGDRVKFVPGERTIGWHQHSFKRLGISIGYVGVVTRIEKGMYIYLDDDRGGFSWDNFKEFRGQRNSGNSDSGDTALNSR